MRQIARWHVRALEKRPSSLEQIDNCCLTKYYIRLEHGEREIPPLKSVNGNE